MLFILVTWSSCYTDSLVVYSSDSLYTCVYIHSHPTIAYHEESSTLIRPRPLALYCSTKRLG